MDTPHHATWSNQSFHDTNHAFYNIKYIPPASLLKVKSMSNYISFGPVWLFMTSLDASIYSALLPFLLSKYINMLYMILDVCEQSSPLFNDTI